MQNLYMLEGVYSTSSILVTVNLFVGYITIILHYTIYECEL